MAISKEDKLWAHNVRNDMFLFSAEPDFSQWDLSDLFKVLTIADDAYHNAPTPIFHDEEYDAIRKFCETADPDNSYFLGVGSEVRGGKVKLPYQMGSLTQAYIGGDTEKWILEHVLVEARLVVTEKLDGISALLVYGADGKLQIAYSRGDGIEGADITRHVSKIRKVPKQVNSAMVVRAEIIFSKKDWEVVKTKIKRSGGASYKNARNATAGLMNASESDPVAYDYLSVVAYEILTDETNKSDQLGKLSRNSFSTPEYTLVQGDQCSDQYLTTLVNDMREKSRFEIDGIVIDVDSASLRSEINPSKDTLNPEYARKFKVADVSNQAVATVVEVQWNISKNGYLKPRVRIEPVELVGVTVQHATGFNAKFIKDNNIGPGAQIRITRSGDVIPFIQGVVTAAKAPQMPSEDCEWTTTGVDLVVKNANQNATVQLEQLIDFAAKMGFEYLGEGNLEKIFAAGFETPTQLLNISEFELTQLIGANGKKIYKSLVEKTDNIPWYQYAGAHPAFGRGIGVRKMKKLYEAFEGDHTKLTSVPSILAVEGFEMKTASKIAAGYTAFMNFVTNTKVMFAKYEAPKAGGLSGQTFLFTGFRSSDLEAKIVEQGGKISSSVSSKLTYLVAADVNDSSGKLKKAREVGTKIISREELIDLLGV